MNPNINLDELYTMMDKAKKYDELAKYHRDKVLHCSFCGKSQDSIEKLIAGPGVYICNECTELCVEILEEEGVKKHE